MVDHDRKCGKCGHRSIKHRDFTKACRECNCKAFIVGGRPAPSVTTTSVSDPPSRNDDKKLLFGVRYGTMASATRKAVEELGDVAAALSREAKRLANKKRKPS